MTNRIDFKRAFLAGITAAAVALALVLVAGGSPASADSPATLDWTKEMNDASYWVTYGSQTHGEDDWVCIKDDNGPPEAPGAYVIGDPPDGSVWRLLVVKAGSTVNDLHWNPLSGQSFEHSEQGGWSHVILCSRPFDDSTTTTVDDSTTTTVDDSTTTTVDDSTTTTVDDSTTTTVPETTPTTAPESTTTSDTVLGTSIVTTTTVVVSPTDETLPFTGADSGTQAALALVLIAGGALALVGARAFRAGTDE